MRQPASPPPLRGPSWPSGAWALRAGRYVALATALTVVAACSKPDAPAHVQASDDIQAGRYLTLIGGCNDCHTPGYSRAHGAIPETERLTGNSTGYRGPWGVSYASNLRLLAQATTEDG